MSITSPDDRLSTYEPVVPTTEFAAGFPIYDNDDLIVVHDGVERDDFTVSATYIAGVADDARTVFAVGITGKVEVVGRRDPRRTNQFQPGGPLPIRDFNLALNTLTAEGQETRRDIDRAFKAPFGTVPPAPPQPATDKVIGWDENGNMVNFDPAEFINLAGLATADQGAKADEAHARTLNSSFVYSISALAALNVAKNVNAYLSLGLRSGFFELKLQANLTAPEAAAKAIDTVNALFVQSTHNAAYVWVRKYGSEFRSEWAGVVGDGATNDSGACQKAIDLCIKMAPLFCAAMPCQWQRGTIIADGLVFYPGTQMAWRSHAHGEDATIFKRRNGGTNDVWTIGANPAPQYMHNIDFGHMTIDGFSSAQPSRGLVLNLVFYSNFPGLKIINCERAMTMLGCAYLKFDTPDFYTNKYAVTSSKITSTQFGEAPTAQVEFIGGKMTFNSKLAFDLDYTSGVVTKGTGLEECGTTPGTAGEGLVVIGANCNRQPGNLRAPVFTQEGGHAESAIGESAYVVKSGLLILKRVYFHEPANDVTPGDIAANPYRTKYSVKAEGGNYSLEECITTTTKAGTTNIHETAGVATGNVISLCLGFSKTIDSTKTSVRDAAITIPNLVVGGPQSPDADIAAQNSTTIYHLKLEGGVWQIYNGTNKLAYFDATGGIIPFADNTGALGDQIKRWANLHVVNTRSTGTIQALGLGTSVPASGFLYVDASGFVKRAP